MKTGGNQKMIATRFSMVADGRAVAGVVISRKKLTFHAPRFWQFWQFPALEVYADIFAAFAIRYTLATPIPISSAMACLVVPRAIRSNTLAACPLAVGLRPL